MRNAFVTGGSRGVGRAIVLGYIAQGWGVGFTYASNLAAADETVALAKEINPDAEICAYQLNLADADKIETVAERAIDDFGDITAVVNNAATIRDNAAALMSNEEWNEVVAVNLTAPFIVSRSFLLHFLSNRKGRLIHISSLAAYGSSGQVNYAASKSGLHGMSITIAKEYGKKNITSNIVTVGFVPTSLTEDNMTQSLQDYWLTYCPAKRVGTGEEIASAVIYLSGDEAGFINGEDLRISGGLTYAP